MHAQKRKRASREPDRGRPRPQHIRTEGRGDKSHDGLPCGAAATGTLAVRFMVPMRVQCESRLPRKVPMKISTLLLFWIAMTVSGISAAAVPPAKLKVLVVTRVVFVQLGHGPEAFENTHYLQLIAQSIRWTARKTSGAIQELRK